MKLSIVVPCYNEQKNISLILNRFNEAIVRDDVEVILVNNGSTDHSQDVFDELVPKFPFARVLHIKVNEGMDMELPQVWLWQKDLFMGYTHADMQTDPRDVIRALTLIEAQNHPHQYYVKGDRKGRSFIDQFFTSGMSLFESIYLGEKLWDINAQPNIFHKSFFLSLENTPKDFSLDLFFLYQTYVKGLKIRRFDVVFPERMHGQSSWNTGISSKWKFIKRTMAFSFKLKKQL